MKTTYRLTIAILIALTVVSTVEASRGDYLAYSISKNGERPLPEFVEEIAMKQPEDLVNVRWGDYAGGKMRIGVLETDNDSQQANFRVTGPDGQTMSWSYSGDMGQQVPVNGIDAMLKEILIQTGRFRVLARKQQDLDSVLDEQDFGESGRVSKPSAAKIGKMLGAEYLVKVTINSYEANVSGKKGGGIGILPGALAGLKIGKDKSYVSMTIELINAETGEAVFADRPEVTITKKKLTVGGAAWGGAGALGGFMSKYSTTPIGQAVIAALNKGVYELVKEIGNPKTSGSVIKATADQIVLNLGSDRSAVGDTFEASSKGEAFVDPETGETLASDMQYLGTLRITKVSEKVSYAEAVDFDPTTLSRGDQVLSTEEPESIEFASMYELKKPKWKKMIE